MSELMPCQMCGGEAIHAEEDYDGMREPWETVACPCCGVYGPLSEWEPARFGLNGPARRKFTEDQIAKHQEITGRLWNEMQTFIARGRLLDSAPITTTRGRP